MAQAKDRRSILSRGRSRAKKHLGVYCSNERNVNDRKFTFRPSCYQTDSTALFTSRPYPSIEDYNAQTPGVQCKQLP